MKKKAASGKAVWLLLILVPLAVYCRVLTLDFINIDDYHFIVKENAFNKDLSNVSASFGRGLFRPADSTIYDYYRPLFLADIVLEYHLFGEKPFGYHLTNLLWHILSVCLLFLFFKRIGAGEGKSLILSLVFAVHPAISPAVAWIAGRNDMMLMVFLLAAMIFMIDYGATRKRRYFLLQALFFLLAVFTKETAVIIPVLAGMILAGVLKYPRKTIFPMAISWLAVILVWVVMESVVKQSGNRLPVDEMVTSGLGRVPALLQYLGKAIIPVNLMVHPKIEEISLIWGIMALALLAALIYWSGSYRKVITWTGAAWFLLFLLPVLVVPRTFSDLVYEHRLYVPLAGILMMVGHSLPFEKKLAVKPGIWAVWALILVFGVMSFIRTGYFKGPLEYWSRAAAESPEDAYSLQMMGTWVSNDTEQEKIFLKAHSIDPALKDINLNLGKLAYKLNRRDEAEQYLKKELALPTTKEADNYFLLGRITYEKRNFGEVKHYLSEGLKLDSAGNAEVFSLLAKVAFMEKSFDSAVMYLNKVTLLDPYDAPAHSNLVIIYMKQGRKDLAQNEIAAMRSNGLSVPPELLRMVNGE